MSAKCVLMTLAASGAGMWDTTGMEAVVTDFRISPADVFLLQSVYLVWVVGSVEEGDSCLHSLHSVGIIDMLIHTDGIMRRQQSLLFV